jgi:hypothetical protein
VPRCGKVNAPRTGAGECHGKAALTKYAPRGRRGGDVTRTRKIAIRWAFALTLVALPVELAVARFAGEPYPAIFQPAFAGSPQEEDYAIVQAPHAFIVSGSELLEVPYQELVPGTEVLPLSIFNSIYMNEARYAAADTKTWLKTNLSEMYPGRAIDGVEIEWREELYAVQGGELLSAQVTHAISIDLM